MARSSLSQSFTRVDDSEWDTIESNYDERHLYIKASDRRGHSQEIRVRLPDWIIGMLQDMMRSVDGYRSMADVCRDAIAHRAHQISQWPDNDPAFKEPEWKLQKAWLERQQAEEQGLLDYIDNVKESLEHFAAENAQSSLKAVLEGAIVAAETLDPGMIHLRWKLEKVIHRYRVSALADEINQIGVPRIVDES